ncbi:unnamed protein product, partial [Allacma fusca]
RQMYKATTASDLTYPSQESSNVLHFPSAEITLMLSNDCETNGEMLMLAPPTIAESHNPLFRANIAYCSVEKLAEQALSNTQLGPLKLNAYEIRSASML